MENQKNNIKEQEEAVTGPENEKENFDEECAREREPGDAGICCAGINDSGKAAGKKSTKEELEKAKAETLEMKNIAQRVQAEFENYKKRNKDIIRVSYEDGKYDAVTAILPVLDNIGRALTHIKDEASAEGVRKVEKQLIDILAKLGVTEIESEGARFDPKLHDAVLKEQVEGLSEDMITEVMMKGYITNDGRVLRHAMVKVCG